MQTTTIGSFPKAFLGLSGGDWFTDGTIAKTGPGCSQRDTEPDLLKATRDVIKLQEDLGFSVTTDGEVRRANYIHHLCRHIDGVSFGELTRQPVRDGAYVADLPTVFKPISCAGVAYAVEEWQAAQRFAESSEVKYTLPGPMTIADTTSWTRVYPTARAYAEALAPIIRQHVEALRDAGCRQIQIDEPVLCRQPQAALDWGLDLLRGCFGNQCGVNTLHACCGYPGTLDDEDYVKAEPGTYRRIGAKIDSITNIHQLSIEDAHCHNNLALLLPLFKNTTIVLGVVACARSRVEPVEEIVERVHEALRYIDRGSLILAPDCGLGMLPAQVLKAKLMNLHLAASSL